MDLWGKNEKMVEAIDDGRIVKVSESYAKREGLLILRKNLPVENQGGKKFNPALQFEEDVGKNKIGYGLDNYRKPLRWEDNPGVRTLVKNFHWRIQKARRQKGLTRRQLSNLTGIKESILKMFEHGFLPENYMVLITRIEEHLGVVLRKDAEERSVQPARELAEQIGKVSFMRRKEETQKKEISEMIMDEEGENEEMLGDEIELDEDDD